MEQDIRSLTQSDALPTAHEAERARSYALLNDARRRAGGRYKSADARKIMVDECTRRSCGRVVPKEWQLDVAECIILGVDCEVIAPTGAGKTIPFILPVFYQPKKEIVIISPLIALQKDQVC
ncbi:hypothetical protein BC834DRAFT_963542 [Gloeopeniophorella convolvens]|nr:hypothetical protein BC834DRAFT_963542 [Gloeopeniophorella convolvens]